MAEFEIHVETTEGRTSDGDAYTEKQVGIIRGDSLQNMVAVRRWEGNYVGVIRVLVDLAPADIPALRAALDEAERIAEGWAAEAQSEEAE